MGKAFIQQSYSETSIKDASLIPENALEGEVFYNNTGRQIGKLPNNSGWNSDNLEAGSEVIIPAGFHDGTGKVVAKSLSDQTEATAGSGDLLSGKTAYVNGEKIKGTIQDKSGQVVPWCGYEMSCLVVHPRDANQALITAPNAHNIRGYFDESSSVTVNVVGVIPSNIRAGIRVGRSSLYGADDTNSIVGTFTADATAESKYILKGMTAGVNGSMVVGTMNNLTESSTLKYEEGNDTKVILTDMSFVNTNTDGVKRLCLRYLGEGGYITNNTLFGLDIGIIAPRLGITPERLVQGVNILDVVGTAKPCPSYIEVISKSGSGSTTVPLSSLKAYVALVVTYGKASYSDPIVGVLHRKVSDFIADPTRLHIYYGSIDAACLGKNDDNSIFVGSAKNCTVSLYTSDSDMKSLF